MTKRHLSIFVIVIIIIIGSLQYGFAAGIGIGVNGGVIRASLPIKSPEDVVQATEFNIGASIIVDSNIAGDRLFNYRMLFSYDNSIGPGGKFFGTYSYNRLSWVHSFGFGFLRTPFLRIWTGPQVGISYEFPYEDNKETDPYVFGFIGPVLGFNINFGNVFTITIEIGVRAGLGGYTTFGGKLGMKVEPYALAGMIFRIGDTFQADNTNAVKIPEASAVE